MYNDVANLVKKIDSGTVDEYGDAILEEEKIEIFVNIKSVSSKEFYTAQTAGYDPKIVFVIEDYYDYDNQPFIEYDGVMYKVIRTYRTGNSLQITCQHYEGE